MLDTARVQWSGINLDGDTEEWLRQEYAEVSASNGFYRNSPLKWQGVNALDPILGTVSIKSNRTGNYLAVERSLPKFLHGDNCRLLSRDETKEALTLWMGAVEEKFRPFFPPDCDMLRLRKTMRVDLCYQRQFPCASEVFPQIAANLNNKKQVRHHIRLSPTEERMTGIQMKQSCRELVRFYDKGVESGNEAYHDVVRHEEQIRGDTAGWLVDISGAAPVLNVAGALYQMNKRFEGWGASSLVESHEIGRVLEDNGAIGGAAVALAKCPELEQTFKTSFSKSMFHRAKRLAAEIKKSAVTLDLSVPDDAWTEPMVL